MASLAVSVGEERGIFRDAARDSGPEESALLRRQGAPGAESGEAFAAYERGIYRPSNARSFGLISSSLAVLGMVAALASLNMRAHHLHRHHLTTMDIENLDITPPPPPPQATKVDTPVPPSRTFAPKPLIQIPAPGPQQMMVDAPPPPPPPAPAVAVTTNTTPAPAAPAPAPKAATTMEGGDLASKVLYAKPPSYPLDSRRAHEQGTVKLLLLVGSDGTVQDIQIAGSSGSERLDKAALGAVKHWRWQPTMSGGTAVAVRGYVTIPFVLKG